MTNPTYGELIQLLDDAESECENRERSVAEILSHNFTSKYPHIPIHRCGRFMDTVIRIAAPTRSSVLGQQKLIRSPLQSYLGKQWAPYIRSNILLSMLC
jgi:hypothetical protein